MTHRFTPARLLRIALLVDALGSGAAGLLLTAAGGALAGPLGLPAQLLLACGLFFLPYAAFVGWLSRRERLTSLPVIVVVAGNTVWGLESVAALALGWLHPTALGVAFVLAQAGFVFAMAALQYLGLKASRVAAASAA